jgi:hypothetical protein
MRILTLVTCSVLLFSSAVHAQSQNPVNAASPTPPPTPPVPKRISIEFMTLDFMRQKGIITQEEYESAIRDIAETAGSQAGESLSLVLGRWSTTMYGFVELDVIGDSTQSFTDRPGNTLVQRADTYAGKNGRFTMSVRNSRIGFKLRAPEYFHVRASAMLEMDFLGNQPPTASESAFFTNPTFRIRHMNFKLETPIVDLLFGQYWQLFGWQGNYHLNTVEIQGVPGQIYSRTPQIRLSKTVKTKPVTFEAAVAMMRAPQRDAWVPEGQGGLRIAFNDWKARQTTGSTGTATSPLSFAVTGDVRQFQLPEFTAKPLNSVPKTGWGVAGDAFVPLIPVSLLDKAGSLAVQAEYAWTYGAADLYTDLNGGIAFPALPNPTGAMPAPTYTPNVDGGLVVFDVSGVAHLIQWQSWNIGAQYYFPGLRGRMWLSGNYAHMDSKNSFLHGAKPSSVRKSEDWFDVNLFADPTPAVRIGVEYAWFADTYADGAQPINHHVQLGFWYIF